MFTKIKYKNIYNSYLPLLFIRCTFSEKSEKMYGGGGGIEVIDNNNKKNYPYPGFVEEDGSEKLDIEEFKNLLENNQDFIKSVVCDFRLSQVDKKNRKNFEEFKKNFFQKNKINNQQDLDNYFKIYITFFENYFKQPYKEDFNDFFKIILSNQNLKKNFIDFISKNLNNFHVRQRFLNTLTFENRLDFCIEILKKKYEKKEETIKIIKKLKEFEYEKEKTLEIFDEIFENKKIEKNDVKGKKSEIKIENNFEIYNSSKENFENTIKKFNFFKIKNLLKNKETEYERTLKKKFKKDLDNYKNHNQFLNKLGFEDANVADFFKLRFKIGDFKIGDSKISKISNSINSYNDDLEKYFKGNIENISKETLDSNLDFKKKTYFYLFSINFLKKILDTKEFLSEDEKDLKEYLKRSIDHFDKILNKNKKKIDKYSIFNPEINSSYYSDSAYKTLVKFPELADGSWKKGKKSEKDSIYFLLENLVKIKENLDTKFENKNYLEKKFDLYFLRKKFEKIFLKIISILSTKKEIYSPDGTLYLPRYLSIKDIQIEGLCREELEYLVNFLLEIKASFSDTKFNEELKYLEKLSLEEDEIYEKIMLKINEDHLVGKTKSFFKNPFFFIKAKLWNILEKILEKEKKLKEKLNL
jgi:hypothetical protein